MIKIITRAEQLSEVAQDLIKEFPAEAIEHENVNKGRLTASNIPDVVILMEESDDTIKTLFTSSISQLIVAAITKFRKRKIEITQAKEIKSKKIHLAIEIPIQKESIRININFSREEDESSTSEEIVNKIRTSQEISESKINSRIGRTYSVYYNFEIKDYEAPKYLLNRK